LLSWRCSRQDNKQEDATIYTDATSPSWSSVEEAHRSRCTELSQKNIVPVCLDSCSATGTAVWPRAPSKQSHIERVWTQIHRPVKQTRPNYLNSELLTPWQYSSIHFFVNSLIVLYKNGLIQHHHKRNTMKYCNKNRRKIKENNNNNQVENCELIKKNLKVHHGRPVQNIQRNIFEGLSFTA
jgi:hypothetical protein